MRIIMRFSGELVQTRTLPGRAQYTIYDRGDTYSRGRFLIKCYARKGGKWCKLKSQFRKNRQAALTLAQRWLARFETPSHIAA